MVLRWRGRWPGVGLLSWSSNVLLASLLFVGDLGCEEKSTSGPPPKMVAVETESSRKTSNGSGGHLATGGEEERKSGSASPKPDLSPRVPPEAAENVSAEPGPPPVDAKEARPAGASSKPLTKKEAPPTDVPRLPHTFAPIGADSPTARTCHSDADCAVSCYRDGRCCKELCGCSQVYNQTYARKLAQAVAQSCSPDVVCPVARCRGTPGGTAVCEEGQCALKRAAPSTPPRP